MVACAKMMVRAGLRCSCHFLHGCPDRREPRGQRPPDEEAGKEPQRVEAGQKETSFEAAAQEGSASSGQGGVKRVMRRRLTKQSGGLPDEEAGKEPERVEAGQKESSFEAAAQEGSTSSGQGGVKRVIRRLTKQSGERGICWKFGHLGWELKIQQKDGKSFRNNFAIMKYMKRGYTEEGAANKALEDAKTCKKDLVRRGIVKNEKESKHKAESHLHSAEVGLYWFKNVKKWRARIRVLESGKRKVIGSKWFKPKTNSKQNILQARTEAEEYLRDLKAKHAVEIEYKRVKSMSEMVHRQSHIRGITWSRFDNRWLAQFNLKVNGKWKKIKYRPRMKNESEEEVERTFQEAAAWLKAKLQQRAASQDLAATSKSKVPRKK